MSENIWIGVKENCYQFEGIKNKAKELVVWLVDLSTYVGKVVSRWLKEMQHKSLRVQCSSLMLEFTSSIFFYKLISTYLRTDLRNCVLILGLHLNLSIARTMDHWASLHLLNCIVLNLLYKMLLKIVWQKLVPYFVTTSRV